MASGINRDFVAADWLCSPFQRHHGGAGRGNRAELGAIFTDLCVRLETDGGVQRVFANGQDVTNQNRTHEVSYLTPRVSALRPVRDALLSAQREMGRQGRVVLEGRDIGTVVFPDADLKFFLSATPEVRGKRRYDELVARGEKTTLQETVAAVVQRDEQDSRRDIAPLRRAEDAIDVDSSDMGIDEVVACMEAFVRQKNVCEESAE